MYFSKVSAVVLALSSSAAAAFVDSRQPTIASSSTSYYSSYKCGPTNSFWPPAWQWAQLNATVGGRLIKAVPVGSVCHTTTIVEHTTLNNYNAAQCANVQSNLNTPQVSFLHLLFNWPCYDNCSDTSFPRAQ